MHPRKRIRTRTRTHIHTRTHTRTHLSMWHENMPLQVQAPTVRSSYLYLSLAGR